MRQAPSPIRSDDRTAPHAAAGRRRAGRTSGRLAVGSLAVFALVLAGCGGDDDDTAVDPIATESGETSAPVESSNPPGESSTSASDPDAEASAPTQEGPVDAFRAVTIAASEGPGTVVDIDRDDGRWEVEVRLDDGSGVELDIDVATGEVVDRSEESVPDAPPITIEQAMTSAMEAAPGGEVTQAELDDDDGRLYWDVEIDRGPGDDDEVDVKIDATTGEVIEVDEDD